MTYVSVPLMALCMLVALGGCERLGLTQGTPVGEASRPLPPATATTGRVLAPQIARTATALDQTSEAERAAALARAAAGAELGRLVVSLGNPAEQGFWLRSALVTAPRPGIARLASGQTVQVDLLPAAGGGPQLSLAAYRALGLGLTDLPMVTVLSR